MSQSGVVGNPEPIPGVPPDRVHLVPLGEFKGIDGRGPWRVDGTAIVQEFERGKLPLVIDFDHLTDHTSAHGGSPAPAAGWIVAMQAEADGVWGTVEWTPRGRQAIKNRDYRFLSPVFLHSRVDGTVRRILRAALTNAPNLSLTPVLNAQEGFAGGEPMTIGELLQRGRDEVAQARLLRETEAPPIPNPSTSEEPLP